MSFKQWVLPDLDKEGAALLAEEGQMHPFLALMLTTRGIRTTEEAADFLLSGELTDDPFGFADMDAAVERIQRAIDRGERIAVFGDYDADGVTSTVLLYDYLVSREDVYKRQAHHRPGYAAGSAHADFGRGHQLGGYPDRNADSEGFSPDDGGTHHLCHRPPALHHPGCGSHSGAG